MLLGLNGGVKSTGRDRKLGENNKEGRHKGHVMPLSLSLSFFLSRGSVEDRSRNGEPAAFGRNDYPVMKADSYRRHKLPRQWAQCPNPRRQGGCSGKKGLFGGPSARLEKKKKKPKQEVPRESDSGG